MDPAGESSTPTTAEQHRAEQLREATVMVLYVSVVLLAALVALPADYSVTTAEGSTHGPALWAIIWGTTIGLALAHWFAFRLTALWYRGGKVARADLDSAAAQLIGAAAVAAATTIPILLVPPAAQVDAAAFAPALIIGVVGYRVAQAAGRSTTSSVFAALLVLLLATAVACLKAFLGGH